MYQNFFLYLNVKHVKQHCSELRSQHAVNDEVDGGVDHSEKSGNGINQELSSGSKVKRSNLMTAQNC